jgi:hypothetical protein
LTVLDEGKDMHRFVVFFFVVAAVLSEPGLGADPPKPQTPKAWANEQHGEIVVEACTRVWTTTDENSLTELKAILLLQAEEIQKKVGEKAESVRVLSVVADGEAKRLQEEWTKAQGTDAQIAAHEKAEKAKTTAQKLKDEWDRQFYLLELMPSVSSLIESCVKDQLSYLRGEADKPEMLYPPITESKDVNGIWRVSCEDPVIGGEPKIYAGGFILTIEAGDVGGNKLKGSVNGTPAGNLELNGFLHNNSKFSASTPNATGTAPDAFIFAGRVDERDSEGPEAIGTILAVVGGGASCSGEFSRHGNTSPPRSP